MIDNHLLRRRTILAVTLDEWLESPHQPWFATGVVQATVGVALEPGEGESVPAAKGCESTCRH